MRTLICLFVLCGMTGCSYSDSQAPEAATLETDATEVAAPETEATTSTESTSQQDEPVSSDEFVIDVRSKAEWDTGHVGQAVHIPHTEIAERIGEVTEDKDAKIVVYCAVGGRAGKARTALESLGFTNVENAGGYDDVKDRFK